MYKHVDKYHAYKNRQRFTHELVYFNTNKIAMGFSHCTGVHLGVEGHTGDQMQARTQVTHSLALTTVIRRSYYMLYEHTLCYSNEK